MAWTWMSINCHDGPMVMLGQHWRQDEVRLSGAPVLTLQLMQFVLIELDKGPVLDLEWPATVSHRIDQMIETHTAKPALKDGFGISYTYDQMNRRTNTIATKLVDSGVTEGSHVGVCHWIFGIRFLA